MNDKPVQVLLIEDDPAITEEIHAALEKIPGLVFNFVCVKRLEDALKRHFWDDFDVIFVNLTLLESQGFEALARIKRESPGVPIVVICQTTQKEVALQALETGAQDYLFREQIDSEMPHRVIRYVMDRRRMEKELIQNTRKHLEMKMRYQAVLRSTPNGLCIIAPNWMILWANEAMKKFVVLSIGSLPKREYLSFGVLFPDEDSFIEYKKSVRQSFLEKGIHRKEVQLKRGDQTRFVAEISIVRVDPSETGGGYVATIADITEHKMAEEALKKVQQELIQSEKMSALGRFASGIAHEIRNPLGNIVASAQYCLAKKNETLPTYVREYLEIVLRNAQIANKIIKDLLNFAKPRKITLESGDLQKVIRSSCESVKARCSGRNIFVTCDIDEDLPPVLLDEKQMEEAFLNFLSNSIDAMPTGGDIFITAFFDPKRCEEVVKIRDTGIGISMEHLDKVFEPFFTTKDDGVGLGMCIVHQIVSLHRGKILLRSGEGAYTEVEIRLPIPE